ncbi:hypothetical protein LMG27952_02617 [Paraburkholderia hiiakae]|uniref:Site-specific integrase n=1 Tax=Paraburkholderia hiiakae TaxID=1081782 RepID=A0ABM8NLL7_9BURK|nr:tyrosine-type recombinase/integrase [Paraburkholderia hiiakae]CAD6531742.1 hypothetical protein LMG27952_02617 [Paraburkholderia hiiakae]
MATLEHVHQIPMRVSIEHGEVSYARHSTAIEVRGLPQVFWSDASPWQEANAWAAERMSCGAVALSTVESNMRALSDYANFLESKGLTWFTFPIRKADRCLVQYRGALVDARTRGAISPSTASQRMRAVIQFYRWTRARRILSNAAPLWQDRTVHIRLFDATGFERTLTRVTTDLAIQCRTRHGERLEGGLLPISPADREAILTFAESHASIELYLMLAIGFFTGMRLGTICDLKVATLQHVTPDPTAPGLCRLAVGPGGVPPVHTKFGVTGQVWIPQSLLTCLLDYATSARRFSREAKAAAPEKGTLFLTRYGNTYGRSGSDRSSPVNVEMARLRTAGTRTGLRVLRSFRFHQTRCTFATELARMAIAAGGVINAIAIVKDALLHGDEATAFRYIKFVQKTPMKAAMADDFTRAFCGIEQACKRGASHE